MARYRDTQLQVTENLSDLQNLGPNIYQCLKDWKHILLLKTGYTGASKRTECLL